MLRYVLGIPSVAIALAACASAEPGHHHNPDGTHAEGGMPIPTSWLWLALERRLRTRFIPSACYCLQRSLREM